MRRFVFLTVVALVMAVVLASPAWAETFTVDRIDDPDLSTTPTADDCTAAANDCSLRGAITAANANAGDDTIDIGVTETVQLTAALPNLSSNIEIKGPGADQLAVRGPGTAAATGFRIFNVTSGSVVSISGITISGGMASAGHGGGIQNFGTLTVSDSTITDNFASFAGGGIFNDGGTLTVSNSTISHNSGGEGGGINTVNNDSESQSTTITNSTISGNTSRTSGGGVNTYSGRTTIKFSTITKNTANERFGSGVASFGGNSARTEVLSTIISENTNSDVDFYSGTTNSFVSNGYNLIGDAGNDGNATGAFNQTGDKVATDAEPINPMLGPLADNGGPTMTHALLTDSPAIDTGPPTSGDTICPPPLTDQRGISRPQGSHCDIGAYEVAVEVDNSAPFVTETSPPQQEPPPSVSKTDPVTATFSEPVQNVTPDTFFLERRIAAKTKTDPPKFERVNATVTPPSENSLTAVLDPVQELPKGEYRATITTGVTDMADNALEEPVVWTFTVNK